MELDIWDHPGSNTGLEDQYPLDENPHPNQSCSQLFNQHFSMLPVTANLFLVKFNLIITRFSILSKKKTVNVM